MITTQITERDKKLLLIMAVVLVAAGLFWFVLRPLTADITAAQDDLLAAQQEQADIDLMRAALSSDRAVRDTLAQEADEAAADFFPLMESNELDELVTSAALRCGAMPQGLKITMLSDTFTLAPYAWSAKAAAAAESADSGQSTADPEPVPGVAAAAMDLSLYGTRGDLEAVIDTLAAEAPAMQLTSLAWDDDSHVPGRWFLDLGLTVYMAEQ